MEFSATVRFNRRNPWVRCCRAAWLANFPASDIPKATEAMQLHKEAMCMLNTMEQTCNVKAVFKLMDANADGDDLILDGKKLPLLRQQTRVHDSDPIYV